MKEHKRLLEKGLHKNHPLQQDYILQKGRDFDFEIIEKEIDYKAAKEVESIWIEADSAAYNHSPKAVKDGRL